MANKAGPHDALDRIELELVQLAGGGRAAHELGAFVTYCVQRIERELGSFERWTVRIAPSAGELVAHVRVHDGQDDREATSRGRDGAIAVWDAMCTVEQALREARAARGRTRHDA